MVGARLLVDGGGRLEGRSVPRRMAALRQLRGGDASQVAQRELLRRDSPERRRVLGAWQRGRGRLRDERDCPLQRWHGQVPERQQVLLPELPQWGARGRQRIVPGSQRPHGQRLERHRFDSGPEHRLLQDLESERYLPQHEQRLLHFPGGPQQRVEVQAPHVLPHPEARAAGRPGRVVLRP